MGPKNIPFNILIKEFLRPNLKKLGLFLLIIVLSFTGGIQQVEEICSGRICLPAFGTYYVPILWLPAVIINGTDTVFSNDINAFIFGNSYYTRIILSVVYWYLLSCVIYAMYSKGLFSWDSLRPTLIKVILFVLLIISSLSLLLINDTGPYIQPYISLLNPVFYVIVILSFGFIFVGLWQFFGLSLEFGGPPKFVFESGFLIFLLLPLYILSCLIIKIFKKYTSHNIKGDIKK